MDFLPFKPNAINAVVIACIIMILVGLGKGLGNEEGAKLFLGGVLVGFPAYLGGILYSIGFSGHH